MLNTIFGVIGWVGTLLVFAGVAIRLFRPMWDQYAYYAAIAGLVCVVIYTLSQWREIVRSFGRREARFSAMTLVSIAAVLAILVGLNYLVIRRDKRWDLTATKSFSLSDETTKVLGNLKAPVKVTVYDQPGGFPRFRDALTPYEFASKNLTVEYVDADRQPTRVKQDDVLNYGTVVMAYEGRKERVMSDREQEITNALVKVTTGRSMKAYFIEGHGEKSSTSVDRTGYSSALDVLKRDNFAVDKLVLAQTPEVPKDASVMIIAGPTTDFLPLEIDVIRKYLRGGGKALFMLDPVIGNTMHPVPNVEGLLKEWGISMGHDVVLDVSGVGQMLGTDASVPVITPPYPPHPVTKDFSVMTAYPLAQSVSGVAEANPNEVVQDLLKTGDRSWSESDVKSLLSGGKVSLDEKSGDHKGPITIGLSLSEDAKDAAGPPAAKVGSTPGKPQTRIVVLGDSDFASNAAAGIQGNSDLFVNINNWLTQQEDLISIHPRDEGDRRISLTADQQRRLGWFSLLILPGGILASGLWAWTQRR
jgi:gliding motility-associatede transport system auxiliary component